MNEEIEKYLILLLGVENRPIPSMWHLEKEMFVLSRSNPKVQQFFNFEKHYNGPYSQILQEVVNEPLYYENSYEFDEQKRIQLTDKGKQVFKEIFQKNKNNEKYLSLVDVVKFIRNLYDKLSKNELLFLVYRTYPEYTEFSNIYENLVQNENIRNKIADSLLKKGLVTKKRYKELIKAE